MASERKKNRILSEVATVLLVAAGFFLACAVLTHHPSDPSLFARGSHLAKNACGWIGAYVSAVLLQIFGIGAFLFPAGLFFVGIAIQSREGIVRILSILGGVALSVIALTVFAALQWKTWAYAGAHGLTGGLLGTWVATSLIKHLNPLGASIVTALVFCLSIAASTPIRIARFTHRFITLFLRISIQVTRVLGCYSFYLICLASMRFAHTSAALTKRSSAWAIERLRRWKDHRAKKSMALSVQPSTPVVETGSKVIEPSIEIEMKPLVIAPYAETVARKSVVHAGPWKLPTLDFLRKPPKSRDKIDEAKLAQSARVLKDKLADFSVVGEVEAIRPGPVITLYEFRPGPGIKISQIESLADDLSMALSGKTVRVLSHIPGKSVVGFEVPSDERETVFFREMLQHPDFHHPKYTIPIAMGKDIAGQTVISDLARMPHLLCAGQTGSGKSVFMNGLICSLFYRFTPEDLRMILVDPKFIEFRAYQDIPHLLLPVVDEPNKATIALKWAVREMERRYRILALMGVRNLAGYNQKIEEMGSEVVHDLLFSEENREEQSHWSSGSDWVKAFEVDEAGTPVVGKLPYIVIIVDELADLMMVARKDVELSIARIAQKARAAGIHLVVAMQRPSTDVLTGLIKANLPSRMSFQLATYPDSKTILDRSGAERLLGQGDMLFLPPGSSQLTRLHGAYLADEEIEKIASFLKSQGKPHYREEILIDEDSDAEDLNEGEEDPMFSQAIELVRRVGHASASSLQRHLRIGYNRAARMIEKMEAKGIVGPADGARPREVLL